MIHSIYLCRCRGFKIFAFSILALVCISSSSAAQSIYGDVTDSVAYFKLANVPKPADTIINFSLFVNNIEKKYKLSKRNSSIEFMDDGEKKIPEDLGDLQFSLSADSLYQQLMQSNGIVILQKEKIEVSPLFAERIKTNKDLLLITFILALVLFIPIIYYLQKRKKTINIKPENEVEMQQKKFIENATVPLEIDTVLKGRNALDEILRYIYSMKERLERSEMQNERFDSEKNELERKLIDLEATNNEFLEDLKNADNLLLLTNQFNQGMYDKYIQEFNKYFSSASPMHPIPLEMKTMFTQTIYAIAFHYLSFNNASRKSASDNDQMNVNIVTGKSKENTGKEKVSLKDELNIQKVSGLIIYIAEELKKNGVTSLSDVNFRGYYFKD